jgi:glycosyltransferase involved in cell wall biosynthesis
LNRFALEDNVSLYDFTSNTTFLIANASVLVVPSQAYESFGLTIIEAMAFGVPVVTTNVGGMPEVLAESNAGYACSRDDPMEFSDSSLAAQLGHDGCQAFEQRFMASTMTRKYRRLME